MSLSKQYLKTKSLCKVTFCVPEKACRSAEHIALVGDFNQWDEKVSPMQKQKSGDFKLTLTLPVQQSYQFRYLYDDVVWENDWEADHYIATGVSDAENSVVIV